MGTDGLMGWIQTNIIPLLILVVGAAILNKARKGDIASGVTIAGGVLVAIAVIAIATPGVQEKLSAWMLGLFGVG